MSLFYFCKNNFLQNSKSWQLFTFLARKKVERFFCKNSGGADFLARIFAKILNFCKKSCKKKLHFWRLWPFIVMVVSGRKFTLFKGRFQCAKSVFGLLWKSHPKPHSYHLVAMKLCTNTGKLHRLSFLGVLVTSLCWLSWKHLTVVSRKNFLWHAVESPFPR